MKASELRIGNIIDMGIEGIAMVSGYNLYQKSIHDNGGNFADYYGEWKPIPLTEEWLVKLGFKKISKFWQPVGEKEKEYFVWEKKITRVYDSKFTVNKYERHETGSSVSGWNFKCFDEDVPQFIEASKHVHQLQNLYFALTGEELTIK